MTCEAFIPKEYFSKLFNNPNTTYNFLTLQYDSNVIPTGNSPVYDIFNNFVIYKYEKNLKMQMLMNNIKLIRDYNIERFIINCIIVAIRDTDDITDFIIEQKFIERSNCSYVDKFASSILCSGGIVIKPTKYTFSNYIPKLTMSLGNKTDNNKIYVVRRKLGNIIKAGVVSHSAILQKYNNKYYLTELLETGVRQVEVDIKDIDNNIEFQFEDYHWSK